ncbi:protein Bouncer-like [Puntigrus tetrazona]|uniref:protein Bouncer-like n=1 Tax=Puntigrus tetrazona TaxID=1606681 RepID=UPI001C8A97E9|nr:protein Bouncer-like [Puntigrus tetrazona]
MKLLFSGAVLRWFSGLVLLVLCVCASSVLTEKLFCYYCPQTSFNRSCRPVLSECGPQEVCFTADGRFGRSPVLFSKGCMSLTDCKRSSSQMIRGNNISFSFSCCDRPYCNSGRRWALGPGLLAATAIAVLCFWR